RLCKDRSQQNPTANDGKQRDDSDTRKHSQAITGEFRRDPRRDANNRTRQSQPRQSLEESEKIALLKTEISKTHATKQKNQRKDNRTNPKSDHRAQQGTF
ncbi:MAG: hypothetical protein PVH19_05065, partial [Planctomycetia bacterium]